jgi:DNA (cytosine-5)-methyltransferase 1
MGFESNWTDKSKATAVAISRRDRCSRERRLAGISLFSGVGGLDYGIKKWINVKHYCERDESCVETLKSLMSKGLLDKAPVSTDVTTLKPNDLTDIIEFGSAGFPCQDISIGGHKAGLDGDRSVLVNHVLRLASELKLKWILLENVKNLISDSMEPFFLQLVEGLHARRFQLKWIVIEAKNVGAKHARSRWFGLATHDDVDPMELGRLVPKLDQKELTKMCTSEWNASNKPAKHKWLIPKTACTKTTAARLRMMGNAVVPLQATAALQILAHMGD